MSLAPTTLETFSNLPSLDRQVHLAKLLVSTMAKRLHSESLPVHGFTEEEVVSDRLFKSLGFTEDPSYREAWFA